MIIYRTFVACDVCGREAEIDECNKFAEVPCGGLANDHIAALDYWLITSTGEHFCRQCVEEKNGKKNEAN